MPVEPRIPISKAVDTPAHDEAEVEGHIMRVRAVEPPTDDEAEVEGHIGRWGAVDQPTEGEDADAMGDDPEVDGHRWRSS